MKSKNYSRLSIDKNYYLCCPECTNCIPHIKDIRFDRNKNDFNINYICPCQYPNINKKSYFSALLSEEKPNN